MKVLVMGCGPAGLLAAERAEREDHEVVVAAALQRSVMPGAQYLHTCIEGVTSIEPYGYLKIEKEGTRHGYAEKVYGSPYAPVSWEKYEEGYVPAWHLGEAYEGLFRKWRERIVNMHFTAVNARVHSVELGFDLVISTIPAPAWCFGGCMFTSTQVYFSEKAICGTPEDTIVYNGVRGVPWYRTSNIFGNETTEWAVDPRDERVVPARKPVSARCQCPMPGNVVKLGRFGAWDKNFLLHHTWEKTADALLKMQ